MEVENPAHLFDRSTGLCWLSGPGFSGLPCSRHNVVNVPHLLDACYICGDRSGEVPGGHDGEPCPLPLTRQEADAIRTSRGLVVDPDRWKR